MKKKKRNTGKRVLALLLAVLLTVPASLPTVSAKTPDTKTVETQPEETSDLEATEDADTPETPEVPKEETPPAPEEEPSDTPEPEEEPQPEEKPKEEAKAPEKKDAYTVTLTEPENGLLKFPIPEDEQVMANEKDPYQGVLDALAQEEQKEKEFAPEEEISIEVAADSGYDLTEIRILEAGSKEVLDSSEEAGLLTFQMPETDIVIEADFEEIPEDKFVEDPDEDAQKPKKVSARAAATKSFYLNVPSSKVWYGNYNTRYYTTSENQYAYCLTPMWKAPKPGYYTGTLINDLNTRKAFYYAYGGPGYGTFRAQKGNYGNGTQAQEYAYSHMVIAYIFHKYVQRDNSMANNAFYGISWSLRQSLINKANQVMSMASPPSGYACYWFNTSYANGNKRAQPMGCQIINEGYLNLKKSSANPDMTNGNSMYSLNGAQYGVYTNSGCTSKVATLTTNANGQSNTVTLEPGTYYIKETRAPLGYELDTKVYTASVSASTTRTVSVSDKPINDPAAIEIQKRDKHTGKPVVGADDLHNAQFTVSYYAGIYNLNNLPSKPTREWVFETKKEKRSNGEIIYRTAFLDEYKVGGHNLYKINGIPTIPRGTITIEETKAPEGYNNDLILTDANGNTSKDGIYLATIEKEGDLSKFSGSNTFIAEDTAIRSDIRFLKVNGTKGDSPMANIPFKITNTRTKESHVVYTDKNGVYDSAAVKHSLNTNKEESGAGLWFGDLDALNDEQGALPYGDYTIEELSVPANDGLKMYKGKFKVEKLNQTIDLGKIVNSGVEIGTFVAAGGFYTNGTDFEQDYIVDFETGRLGHSVSDDVTIIGATSAWLEGTLIDKETGKPLLDKDGNPITAEAKATAQSEPDTCFGVLNFEIDDFSLVKGKTIVVYCTAYMLNSNGKPDYNRVLAEHKDIDDTYETLHYPELETTLKVSGADRKEVSSEKEAALVDEVKLINIGNGIFESEFALGKFHIKGTLMDEKGNPVTDPSGKEVTASKKDLGISKEIIETTHSLTYNLSRETVDKYKGQRLTSFVEVTYDDGYQTFTWVTEKDLESEAQSVYISNIDNTQVSKDILSYKDTGITDKVNLSGLVPGNEYTLVGKIVDKETGEIISHTQTKEYGKDDYLIEYVTPGDNANYQVTTKGVVKVYRLLTDTDNAKAGYYRLNDEGTNYVSCKADGTPEGKEIIEKTLFEQSVLYPGEKFKETQQLVSHKAFIPKEKNSTQYVTFTFDPTLLAGKAYVITEELYFGKSEDQDIEIDESPVDNKTYAIVRSEDAPKATAKLTNTSGEHFFAPVPNTTLTDIVTYSGLKPGQEYTMYGKLMVKGTEDVAATAEKTFTPSTSSGTVEVTFNFDASPYGGKTLVAFETLSGSFQKYGEDTYYDDFAIHHDMNDEMQTVTNMSITTSAVGTATGTKLVNPTANAQITDTVTYNGASKGGKFVVEGKLIDKYTGEAALDSNGKEITAKKEFTPSAVKGSVDVIFTFDATDMITGEYVVYEYMYFMNGSEKQLWASHEDINDEKQTVLIPGLETNAFEDKTNSNFIYATGTLKIHDLVTYTGLLPGQSYTLTGTLMDKSTGKAFVDAKGKTATATKTFTPDASEGEVDMIFNIDVSNIKTNALVAFEELTLNGKVVVAEKDMENESQTLFFPTISTSATNPLNGGKTFDTIKDTSIVDTITYKGLQYGMDHIVKTYIMDKATGKVLTDPSGKELAFETEINPEEADGSVDIPLTFDSSNLRGKTIVLFEEIYLGETLIAQHKDINDKAQTMTAVGLDTTAIETGTKTHYGAAGSVRIQDTVKYYGLTPKTEYTLKGTIMVKETKQNFTVDGKPVTVTKTFTPTAANGSVNMNFAFDASAAAGKTLVVYEQLYKKNADGVLKVEAQHRDLSDANQSVHIPSLDTVAVDKTTGIHFSKAGKNMTLTDTLAYQNLQPGKTYTVTGSLVDSKGTVLKDDAGKAITKTSTFTPTKEDGKQVITYTFDGTKLAGKTGIFFETVKLGDRILVEHKDVKDKDQTVRFPGLDTVLVDKKTGSHNVIESEKTVLKDTVTYSGLEPGKTYTLNSELMNRGLGGITVDMDGKEVKTSTQFTPDSESGTVEVEFTLNSVDLKGGTFVAFQTLLLGNKVIAEHKDLNDADQIVSIAKPVVPRELTIIKKIKASDYYNNPGDPTFTFTIKGTDTAGNEQTYTKDMTFTEEYVKAHTDKDGYVSMEVVMDDILSGEYVIEESMDDRWFLKEVSDLLNATEEEEKVNIHLAQNKMASVTFTNEAITGSVSLVKKDDKGNVLKGVEFTIFDKDKKSVASKTTDANGKVLFDNLPAGSYTIEETKGVAGHSLLTKPIDVTIPLVLSAEEAKEQNADTKKAIKVGENYYFYDVTFDVTNSAVLNLPSTGGQTQYLWLLLGIALIGCGVILRKRKKED